MAEEVGAERDLIASAQRALADLEAHHAAVGNDESRSGLPQSKEAGWTRIKKAIQEGQIDGLQIAIAEGKAAGVEAVALDEAAKILRRMKTLKDQKDKSQSSS